MTTGRSGPFVCDSDRGPGPPSSASEYRTRPVRPGKGPVCGIPGARGALPRRERTLRLGGGSLLALRAVETLLEPLELPFGAAELGHRPQAEEEEEDDHRAVRRPDVAAEVPHPAVGRAARLISLSHHRRQDSEKVNGHDRSSKEIKAGRGQVPPAARPPRGPGPAGRAVAGRPGRGRRTPPRRTTW